MHSRASPSHHVAPRGRRAGPAIVVVVVLSLVAVAGIFAVKALRGPVVLGERCTATADGKSFELAPDQAANAATISAIAVRRGLPARAATIAIATAVQESHLRNIDHGDRDSVGLFQQRPSQGWGTVGQIMDPIYATNAFYDVLVTIKGYEAMEITDASHRVQRSAFPAAVADHEPKGRAFASALTGYSPRGLDCRLRPVGDVQRQQVDDDGLLPRTAAVRDAAVAELGDVRWSAAGDGELLRLVFGPGDEAARHAWAAGSWAVAQAAETDVVGVTVDGAGWRRDRPDDGWAAAADEGAATGQNVVTIEVAAP